MVKGQPPILEAIKQATKIGVTGNLNCLTIVNTIKVNIRITLKLFINKEVTYITSGRTIIINVLLPLDNFNNLLPIASKKPLFSNIFENKAKAKISKTISNGKLLNASTKV